MRRHSATRLRFVDFREFDGDDDVYFASPALGSTGLKAYLDPKPPPQRLDLGTAWHWLVFQRDTHAARVIAIPYFGKLQSSTVREERDAWVEKERAQGMLPLPQSDFEAAHKMAESALAIAECRALIEHRDARLEQAQTYRCEEFPEIELRRKPDVDVPGFAQADGKSTAEMTLDGYRRQVTKLMYPLQSALYHDSGVAHWRDTYPLGVHHIVACNKPDRNGDHQAAVLHVADEIIDLGRSLVVAALTLADAARLRGAPTPYLLNARARTLAAPTRSELQQAAALLKHAKETHQYARE
jgi:hypothetical protein